MVNNPTSTGTKADMAAKVDIAKVYGGYFSNPVNAQAFADVGIAPILPELPGTIQYADMGGGTGYLTKHVATFIASKGKTVHPIVVDANPGFLATASNNGLKTNLANIEDCTIGPLHLVSMRAVNHYNAAPKQLEILKSAHRNLACGGYLVSQISTGTDANCALRSAMCNLPSLGRAAEGESYLWVSVAQYTRMLRETGFTDVKLAGYAPSNAWGPEEQWDRFNAAKTADAIARGATDEVDEINARRSRFLAEAARLVDTAPADAGATKDANSMIKIPYDYAIIIAKA